MILKFVRKIGMNWKGRHFGPRPLNHILVYSFPRCLSLRSKLSQIPIPSFPPIAKSGAKKKKSYTHRKIYPVPPPNHRPSPLMHETWSQLRIIVKKSNKPLIPDGRSTENANWLFLFDFYKFFLRVHDPGPLSQPLSRTWKARIAFLDFFSFLACGTARPSDLYRTFHASRKTGVSVPPLPFLIWLMHTTGYVKILRPP